ncbi:putative 5' nucleotidase [Vibrio phage 501E54-1]|nr:putative 5' nucleotidase [Vibrio phage 501E54-1]
MAKRRPIIAVDVDLTITASDVEWKNWLLHHCEFTGIDAFMEDLDKDAVEYKLSEYFYCGDLNPFEFWKLPDLYDGMFCDEMSKVVLKHLYDKGWEIIFLSWCYGKGEHMESKHKMLRREYNFIVDTDFHFMTTKSKNLAKCDYIVDDRNSFINQMDEEVQCFKINTPYTQDEELTRDCIVVDSWSEIINMLEV